MLCRAWFSHLRIFWLLKNWFFYLIFPFWILVVKYLFIYLKKFRGCASRIFWGVLNYPANRDVYTFFWFSRTIFWEKWKIFPFSHLLSKIRSPKSSIAGADFIPYLAYIALVGGLLSIAKNCSGLFPCLGNIRHFSIHSFFMWGKYLKIEKALIGQSIPLCVYSI